MSSKNLVRCEFERFGTHRCKCRLCGRLVRSDDCSRVRSICLTNPEEAVDGAMEASYQRQLSAGRLKQQSAVTLGVGYMRAVARWVAAGAPVRSQAEIDRIFAVCQACEHFADGKHPYCNLCGCSLSQLPDGLKNKIAMATESCPLDPPKWTAEEH